MMEWSEEVRRQKAEGQNSEREVSVNSVSRRPLCLHIKLEDR